MGRKRGFNAAKIAAIVSVLYRNPDGMWLNRIAKETNLHPTTVTKYIEGVLQPLIEETTLGQTGKPLLRVVRLKPFVIERLGEGKTITEVMRILQLMERIGE